jgi:hypothetical protein
MSSSAVAILTSWRAKPQDIPNRQPRGRRQVSLPLEEAATPDLREPAKPLGLEQL